MKIGIIGSGNIGGNLGKHFAKAGHEVFFSSRNPEKLFDLVNEAGENGQSGKVEEAAVFGEVILLATPYGMLPKIHEKIGDLDGKVLIDATNYYARRDGTEIKEHMDSENLQESQWVARYFKGASVVKAFNTIGANQLRDEAFAKDGDHKIVPYAAADEKANEHIKKLISDIGFRPAHVGGLEDTKKMEPGKQLYIGFPTAIQIKPFVNGW